MGLRSIGRDADGVEQFIGVVDDQVVLRTTYDNQAVIDQNKRLEGHGMGKELRLAASIPPGVQFEWLTKYGVRFWDPNHKKKVRELLNSSEYRYLRINHFIM
jgi:hypothetical protein